MSNTRRQFLAGIGVFTGGGITGVAAHRTVVGGGNEMTIESSEVTLDDDRDYEVTLVDVIDGDTADFIADMGLNTKRKIRVRPTDIDTAEIHGVSEDSDEYELGMEQKQFVEDFLGGADTLVFRSEEDAAAYTERFPDDFDTPRDGKGGFGRWLGDVNADGVWWNDAVLERWPDATYDG